MGQRFAGQSGSRLLLTGLGLAALLYSWFFTWRYFTTPVWFDLWYWVEDLQKLAGGHYSFRELIRPQSEHRIATTRLLLLIDSTYFGLSGHFVAVCNEAALLVLGLLMGRLSMQGVSRRTAWYVPAVVWAGFVAGTCQSQNLLLAFQVQFALTCCAALGAAWLFAEACDTGLSQRASMTRALGGAAFALLALFSMGSGILLLPAVAVVLWLRRAQSAVWVVFAVWAAAALMLEVPSHLAMQLPAKLPGLKLLPQQIAHPPGAFAWLAPHALFSAYFLGSALMEAPKAALLVGFAGYALLLALAAPPAWRWSRGGPALPVADTVLLALALFAAMCGPAASTTLRMLFGPGVALVPRYATMSLLFWGACGGLVLRALNAAGGGNNWARGLVVAAVGGLLYVANLPSYAVQADIFNRTILAEAELLTNNIGVAGPVDVIFSDGVPRIRGPAGFLHQAGLNMFAPGQEPPADLLARLAAAAPGSLPACRGAVDQAVAIDSGAMVLSGWLADPDGRHTAPWIAVRDAAGRIVGTARSLQLRKDLTKANGFKTPAYGFVSGFRDDAEGTRQLRLAAVFPDRAVRLCELPAPAEISGVQVQPIAELRDLQPAPLAGAPAAGPGLANFATGAGDAPLPQPDLGPVPLFATLGGEPLRPGAVDFAIGAGVPANAALVLPFWTPPASGWKSVTFVLGDGTRLAAPLGPWWGRRFWRAAVLPAELARQHGGAVRVEVRDPSPGAMTVAAPMLATPRPGWSRLF